MGVPKYTTPTVTLNFSEETLDLTQATNIALTFRYPGGKTTLGSDRLTVEAKSITAVLTQEETGRFSAGNVMAMANWVIAGMRFASEKVAIVFDENYLAEVMT